MQKEKYHPKNSLDVRDLRELIKSTTISAPVPPILPTVQPI